MDRIWVDMLEADQIVMGVFVDRMNHPVRREKAVDSKEEGPYYLAVDSSLTAWLKRSWKSRPANE